MSHPIPPYYQPQAHNIPARRAGMLILALGCVALLIGGLCALMAVLLPTLVNNPEFAKSLEQMKSQTPLDPQLLIGVMAGIFLAYALAAIPLGLLARRGRLPWVIAALVFVLTAGLFVALSTLANLVMGNLPGVFLPGLLTALHGLAATWLIGALRDQPAAIATMPSPQPGPGTATPLPPQSFILPPPPQPMQDYYLPIPPPPAPRQ